MDSTPVPRRDLRPPPVFWALVALSALTLAAGVYLLMAGRQRASEAARPVPAVAARSIAPQFRLQNLQGEPVSLEGLRGKVVLLNFWATWCPPCKAELPDLNSLHNTYGAEHEFIVVGIDMEEDASSVQAFLAERPVDYPVLLDLDGHVSADLYSVRNLPMSLIIDRNGKIRDAWTGQLSKQAILIRLQRVW